MFAVALLFGLLPALPPLSLLNDALHVPLQAPLVAAWFVLMFLGRQESIRDRWVVVPVAMATLGLVGVLTSDFPLAARTWAGAVVVPLLFFAGLQLALGRDLALVRGATRWILFLVVAVQVVYYVVASGFNVLSPSYVVARHTDVAFWERVGGDVLGNPNNASVVFCAALAWALAEATSERRPRLHRAFIVVSGAAIWVTGSRGALLTAAILVLLAAWAHASRRRRPFILGAAVVGLGLGITYWLVNLDPAGTGSAGDSVSLRGQARLAAIPVVLRHPWGTGPGSTADTLHPALVKIFGSDSNGATSHDLFLNWGVSLGLVGLALLLLTIVIAFRTALRNGGLLNLLPLLGFLLAGESAGIDVVNPSNAAWAVLLWTLLGLAWRGEPFGQERVGEAEVHASADSDGGQLDQRNPVPDRLLPFRRRAVMTSSRKTRNRAP